jgi:hypothetical protein
MFTMKNQNISSIHAKKSPDIIGVVRSLVKHAWIGDSEVALFPSI